MRRMAYDYERLPSGGVRFMGSDYREYCFSDPVEIKEMRTSEEAGVSGRANEQERHGLQEIEELARAGKIKKVFVHEVSRLARRNSLVHKFVETMEEFGVSLYWHAQGVETLMSNGKRNPAASIMLALLAEMARNEVETLSTRIKSGLAEARRKGRRLGRPPGSGLERSELLAKHRDIIRLLKAGQSVRNTAKISGKGVSTVQRIIAALAA